MKMSRAILIISVFLVIALIWIFFPVAIKADHATFKVLPDSEFAQVRSDAISYGHSVESKGIEVLAGDRDSQSIQFNCKGVPVLTLINGPYVLSILTYAGADERAQAVMDFRTQLFSRFKKSGAQLAHSVALDQPKNFEAFVLEHRYGINIKANCSKAD